MPHRLDDIGIAPALLNKSLNEKKKAKAKEIHFYLQKIILNFRVN
jgi:hypothetical protein